MIKDATPESSGTECPIKTHLRKSLSSEIYRMWIAPAGFARDGNTICIHTPNTFQQGRIKKYENKIGEYANSIGIPSPKFKYTVKNTQGSNPPKPTSPPVGYARQTTRTSYSSTAPAGPTQYIRHRGNKKITNGLENMLDSFSKGENHNPIVIYGTNGVGKTALLSYLQVKSNQKDIPAAYLDIRSLNTILARTGGDVKEAGKYLQEINKSRVMLIDEFQALPQKKDGWTQSETSKLIDQGFRNGTYQIISYTGTEENLANFINTKICSSLKSRFKEILPLSVSEVPNEEVPEMIPKLFSNRNCTPSPEIIGMVKRHFEESGNLPIGDIYGPIGKIAQYSQIMEDISPAAVTSMLAYQTKISHGGKTINQILKENLEDLDLSLEKVKSISRVSSEQKQMMSELIRRLTLDGLSTKEISTKLSKSVGMINRYKRELQL